jgi:threonine/homoserine/homoserine lactone efflux protein
MDVLPTANLAVFFVATLGLLLTPGPAVMYIVARSIDQGRKAGLASVFGIETGAIVHTLAAAFGLSAILVSSALAFDVVKLLGAAYLIYLGVRKLMEKDVTEVSMNEEPQSLRRIFMQGMVVNILNPKTALFFFAFLPQFVEPAKGNVALQIVVLGVMFMLMATVTDSMYALAAGTAGRWLRGNLRFLRFQRLFTGTAYIGLGVMAALAGRGEK